MTGPNPDAAADQLARDRRAAQIRALERKYPLPPHRPGELATLIPYSEAKQRTVYGQTCLGYHPTRPARAERHTWLCHDCTQSLRRDLLALAGCWGFLGELLHRGPAGQGERSGSDNTAAAPLDLNAADLRHEIGTWCAAVVGHLLEDKPGAVLPDVQDPPHLLDWLARWQIPYIATHPQDSFPDAVLEETAVLLGKVRALSFPDGARRRPIAARCARYIPGDSARQAGTLCGGRLSGLIRDQSDPRGSAIVCEADPSHVIPAADWLALLKAKQRTGTP